MIGCSGILYRHQKSFPRSLAFRGLVELAERTESVWHKTVADLGLCFTSSMGSQYSYENPQEDVEYLFRS